MGLFHKKPNVNFASALLRRVTVNEMDSKSLFAFFDRDYEVKHQWGQPGSLFVYQFVTADWMKEFPFLSIWAAILLSRPLAFTTALIRERQHRNLKSTQPAPEHLPNKGH